MSKAITKSRVVLNLSTGIAKIDTKCMIEFTTTGGQLKLKYFSSELKQAKDYINNVNSKKKMDFNIFNTPIGNRSIGLPPEFTIYLNN